MDTSPPEKNSVWKVGMDGGTPAKVLEWADWPTVSPDGKLIAYMEAVPQVPNQKRRIGIVPFDGGPPVKLHDIDVFDVGPLQWTRDGTGLIYVKDSAGVSNLFMQRLSGGPPKQLTDFQTDRIFWFDFSRDGRQVALARGREFSDAVTLRDRR